MPAWCDFTFNFASSRADVNHVNVGSMLARSTLQGMLEPQAVGREAEYSSHIFFYAVTETINNLIKAESGGKEAMLHQT